MNAPEAAGQIVSGLEGLGRPLPLDVGQRRGGTQEPAEPMPLRVEFYIPPNAPRTQVWLVLDGREVASETYSGPATMCWNRPRCGRRARLLRWRFAWTGRSRAPGDQRGSGSGADRSGIRAVVS